MLTVKTVMTQLTDPAILLREVKETLRTLDPDYPEEEKQFLQAAAELEQEIGPGAKESHESRLCRASAEKRCRAA